MNQAGMARNAAHGPGVGIVDLAPQDATAPGAALGSRDVPELGGGQPNRALPRLLVPQRCKEGIRETQGREDPFGEPD